VQTKDQKFRLIQGQRKEIVGLVNQLLDFSRLESRDDAAPGFLMAILSGSSARCHVIRVVGRKEKIISHFVPTLSTVGSLFDRDKLEKIVNNADIGMR